MTGPDPESKTSDSASHCQRLGAEPWGQSRQDSTSSLGRPEALGRLGVGSPEAAVLLLVSWPGPGAALRTQAP